MSNIIFTTSATSKNGRDGHVQSDDGLIDLDLSMDTKSDKNKSNPEQLFASAYSACFDSSLHLVASKESKDIDSTTTANISFMKDPEDDGFKIAAELKVEVKGASQKEAEDLVQKAHQACPYSKATRGNIDVKLHAKAV